MEIIRLIVTDEQIKEYCNRLGYELLHIGETNFEYKRSDGGRTSLLKVSAYNFKYKKGNNNGLEI